ncbi:DUF2815 family protein [Herbaspirillum sp. RTI4]|uniref:ssDNA-binding protein n=1 Tax=Herbaspirillum sp. RTI4 TaxID=3048640 RepID=UPI002AB35151|nr:ssDNA-binding protein [Herbaspirillum sp. RTI4]MDY7579379.1 DUF2815 family protein [Herbaspirillum sp. RTI4]MEA9980293.1 DUF2815 family protein [Herbaspirillum sp. RTI4]
MKITITNVRLAFPNIFEPKVNEQGKAQFGAAFIFAADHAVKKQLDKAIDEVGQAKWGATKWPAMKKQMMAGDNLLIHNGDAKASLDGYEGNLYVNAYNTVRPTVVDRDTSPLVAADGKPYSGCYVNAVLDIWAQDNQYGKKVNAQLQGVQFSKDGDAFAGGGKAAEASDFEAISEGADAEELV